MRVVKSLRFVSALLLLFTITSCSFLKKEDPDKEIKNFIAAVELAFRTSEDKVLQLFETRQNKEALAAALRVIQNLASDHVRCELHFHLASIYRDEQGVRVTVPATLITQNIDYDLQRQSTVTFFLKRKDDTFAITKLDAEQFYSSFLSLRSEISWSVDRVKFVATRESFINRARDFQTTYDSVIWYTQYSNETFFYVVQGKWNNYFMRYGAEAYKPVGHRMGLVNLKGEMIVPVEYDLVGTPGFSIRNVIEVKKDNKVGYYGLDGTQLIPVRYDYIIPYQKENIFAIVRADEEFGWVDEQFNYHPGFPSDKVQQYILEFGYLPENLTLSESAQSLCEIPHRDHVGYGIVIPPSYLTSASIFEEIIGGISTNNEGYNAYTDYIETNRSVFQTVSDRISALITTITERYLDGREEFYTHQKMVLMNEQRQPLATENIPTSGDVDFTVIDDLLQVTYIENYFEGENLPEWNVPRYCYFKVEGSHAITPLSSKRRFANTEFVKLDSSYLSGSFKYYDHQRSREVSASFLSMQTLHYMRNEILASYGFRFEDKETNEMFSYSGWYEPRFDSYLEILNEVSDIDRYNLEFLERILGPVSTGKSV